MLPDRAAIIAYCAHRGNALYGRDQTLANGMHEIVRYLVYDLHAGTLSADEMLEQYLATVDERPWLEGAKVEIRRWRAAQAKEAQRRPK